MCNGSFYFMRTRNEDYLRVAPERFSYLVRTYKIPNTLTSEGLNPYLQRAHGTLGI